MVFEALPETSTSVAAGHADIQNLGMVVDDVDAGRIGNGGPTDVDKADNVREPDKRIVRKGLRACHVAASDKSDQRPAKLVRSIATIGSVKSKGEPFLIRATIVHPCGAKAPYSSGKVQADGIADEVAATARELFEPTKVVDGHLRWSRDCAKHLPLQDRHREVADIPIGVPAAHAWLRPEDKVLVHAALGIEF